MTNYGSLNKKSSTQISERMSMNIPQLWRRKKK